MKTTVACGAAALLAAGAGAAVAAVPKGETVATGLPERLVVDAERAQVVFATSATEVRTLDLASGATRDLGLVAGCTSVDFGVLRAAGDGYALLACLFPAGEGSQQYQRVEPRVLDLSTGETIVPAGLTAAMAYPNPQFRRVVGTTIFFGSVDHRSGETPFTLDWRTGAIAPDPNRPLDCPAGGARWASGAGGQYEAVGCDGRGRVVLHPSLRAGEQSLSGGAGGGLLSWGVDDRAGAGARQHVYVHGCRTRLSWDVPSGTTSWTTGGDLLLKEADGGLTTLRRISLDGLCDRTSRPWRLRVTSGSRSIAAQPATAHVTDAVTGAAATLLQPLAARPATLRATQGARVGVAADATAIALRWRTDGRSWRRAADQGRRWALRLPRGARTLRLDLRLRDGSRAGYVVKLRRAGR